MSGNTRIDSKQWTGHHSNAVVLPRGTQCRGLARASPIALVAVTACWLHSLHISSLYTKRSDSQTRSASLAVALGLSLAAPQQRHGPEIIVKAAPVNDGGDDLLLADTQTAQERRRHQLCGPHQALR